MKAIIDLIPLIGFFTAYIFADIYAATLAIMVLCPLQTLGYRLYAGSYDKTQAVTTLLVLVFGALTLFFHNPHFIQWKFSILYWLFGTVLLGTQWLGYKSLLHHALQGKINVPDAVLKKCNLGWGLFFISMGFMNLYIVYFHTQKTWMYFKLFGATALLFIATIVFALYISRHIADNKDWNP